MANQEHLGKLQEALEADYIDIWNRWKEEQHQKDPEFTADLSDATLREVNLTGADLSGADLTRILLIKADLTRADLSEATLIGADLSKATLTRAGFLDANLTRAVLIEAVLKQAVLTRANLTGATITGADLREADLWDANVNKTIIELTTKVTPKQLMRTKQGREALLAEAIRKTTGIDPITTVKDAETGGPAQTPSGPEVGD